MIMATAFGWTASGNPLAGASPPAPGSRHGNHPHPPPCQVSFVKMMPTPTILTNSNHFSNSAIRAHLSDSQPTGGAADFVAGFLLGGALCGTLAYCFAPQIRRSLLNEDEYGFRKARRPIYYDDQGLEKTRQTLNAKLSQLNAAIDNVSSRLRGVNNMPSVPVASDPEVEATM